MIRAQCFKKHVETCSQQNELSMPASFQAPSKLPKGMSGVTAEKGRSRFLRDPIVGFPARELGEVWVVKELTHPIARVLK